MQPNTLTVFYRCHYGSSIPNASSLGSNWNRIMRSVDYSIWSVHFSYSHIKTGIIKKWVIFPRSTYNHTTQKSRLKKQAIKERVFIYFLIKKKVLRSVPKSWFGTNKISLEKAEVHLISRTMESPHYRPFPKPNPATHPFRLVYEIPGPTPIP